VRHGTLTLERSQALSIATTWGTGAVVAALGLALVIGPSVIKGRIPGDLGDARFNSYILEHFFRWMTGHDGSFWNAGFFYPFPLTIAFSDNFLGNGLIYAAFRSLGFIREDAFRLWYVTGFVLNFIAADYALVRLGFSPLAAALGAFLFTFGLPVTAQEGHAQLIYRFGVPLATLALENFRSRKQLRQLALVGFWTTWQFYCSIYIGYFLTLLLAAFIVGHITCDRGGPLRGIRSSISEISRTWSGSSARAKLALLFTMIVFAALLAVLLMPYLEVSHLYGFRRPWSEIAYMLPRPQSYLLANNSHLWPGNGQWFNALPMRHEHAMFIGVATFLAIVVALILRLSNWTELDRLFAPVSVAILLVVLLTLYVDRGSAYRVLTWLPGVDAIRGVTRIITVLLFPCGVLFASSLDSIAAARVPAWARSATVAFLGILAVLESSYIVHVATAKREWQARMAAVAANVPEIIPKAPILLLSPRPDDPSPWARELDAMLFSQDHGWRTLNGYSGNTPPRPELTGACQDAAVSVVSGLKFLGRSAAQTYDALLHRVLLVDYPPCDNAVLAPPPQLTMFAGPLPTQLMAGMALRIDRLMLNDRHIVVTLEMVNNSGWTLPAYSTTAMPIRLSMRYIDARSIAADLRQGLGWDSRQPIGFDVPPDAARTIVVPIATPANPGSYRVAVSMVQDGVAWFHDHGMQVPISTQIIDVAEDHSVHLSTISH
jgi:hypothetical protein